MTKTTDSLCKIVFVGARKCELATADIPKPGDNEILIETMISGISAGTEGMWYTGEALALKSGRKSYPYFPGYELVGRVAGVGTNVTDFEIGDRVFTMKPHASYVIANVEKDVIFKLEDQISNEDALAIALTGTALHATHRSGVTMCDKVAVVGLGIVGYICIQVLAKVARCRVLALTSSAEKARVAQELGAEHACTYADAGTVSGFGAYAAFECSGTSSGFTHCQQLLRDQGKIIATGFYNQPITLDGEQMFSKELNLCMVRAGGHGLENNPFNRWSRLENLAAANRLVQSGTIKLANLVTHKLSPGDFEQVYQLIADGKQKYGQIIVEW